MVKLFGRGNEEKKEDEEFQRELAAGEQHPPPGQMFPDDYVNSLGRSIYMAMDPDVRQLLSKYPELDDYVISTSHLNRLTKKDRKAIELDILDYDYQILLHKILTSEDEYESKQWSILQALRQFQRTGCYDSLDGFKAKVVTEQIKVIKAELEKKRGKVLPF